MKVFFLVYDLASGGIERIAINTYKYIDKEKFEIDLITKYDQREFFDDELEVNGGKRVPLLSNCSDNGLKRRIKLAFSIPKVMKKGYDIGYFNLNSPKEALKYALLGKIVGIKHIVVHSHNSSDDVGNVISRVLNAFGRIVIDLIADKKLTCSEKAAEWMFSLKTVRNSDFVQVNNGIDLDLFCYDVKRREKIRKQLGIENQFVIGHVGRFSPQKNHKFLINVFNQIKKNRPDSCLILLGTGSMVEEIRNYAKSKNIEESIKFMGAQSNAHDYMQAFDVFLLPSIYEGLPVVGIEAQAAGLKCFFSDAVTKSADITGNVTFLPLTDSPEIWANQIINIFESYERKDVSDIIIRKQFDVKNAVKTIEKSMWELCK